MIDESEILPFNFLSYGGTYTGENNGMRYRIKREGEKPEFILTAWVWLGPLASDSIPDEKKMKQEFEYSEQGRIQAIEWLKKQYNTRIEEWDNAPLINNIEITE